MTNLEQRILSIFGVTQEKFEKSVLSFWKLMIRSETETGDFPIVFKDTNTTGVYYYAADSIRLIFGYKNTFGHSEYGFREYASLRRFVPNYYSEGLNCGGEASLYLTGSKAVGQILIHEFAHVLTYLKNVPVVGDIHGPVFIENYKDAMFRFSPTQFSQILESSE